MSPKQAAPDSGIDDPTGAALRRNGEAAPILSRPPDLARIFRNWWPLAASWLLMAIELPAVSAVMARLPDPEIHLAAYGGIVFPLSMIVEAPIIMLLVASTALSRDRRSFLLVRRFMMRSGAALTALHMLLAFTPLYDIVVVGLIRPPGEIVDPARLGLQIMTPWTWSIAYRRFHQGVLIRYGRSHLVGIGTALRLATNLTLLGIGWYLGLPGIVVGSLAVASGVVAEAVLVGVAVRPVVRERFSAGSDPAHGELLTHRAFFAFYLPLAMTSFLVLAAAPAVSAAMSRMPRALDSLAVWPVLHGLGFLFRSLGLAFNEVVVALLDAPHALANLRRFAWLLAGCVTFVLLLIAATPLGEVYFARIAALPPALASLAGHGLWVVLLLPALGAFQSLYQGVLVHSRRTRGVTESVAVYLVVTASVLAAGVASGMFPGLFVGLGAVLAGGIGQLLWLRWRAQPAARRLTTPAVRDDSDRG